MRVIITIDGMHSAHLLEDDALYRLSNMAKQNDCLTCDVSKETVQKLIEQLQWLLTDPKDPD